MKFSVDKKRFTSLLSNAIDFTQSKSSYSIYSNIFLGLNGNELTIKATNQNYGFDGIFQVKGSVDGQLTVQADKLLDIVRNMGDDEDILLESDNEFLNIYSSVSSAMFQIRFIGAESYNYPARDSNLKSVVYSQESLLEMCSKTVISVSTDESKPNICGVFLKFKKDGIEAVSTDTKCLTYYKKPFDFPDDVASYEEITIPTKFVRDIIKVAPGSGVAELSFNENVLYINLGMFTIWTTLIKGQFPKFTKLVELQYENSVVIAKNIIESMIKRVTVMSDSTQKAITFNFSQDKLTLTSFGGDDLGFGKEDANVEYKGSEVSFAIYYQYLQNQLKVIDNELIKISFNKVKEPIRVESAGDSYYFNIILSMES